MSKGLVEAARGGPEPAIEHSYFSHRCSSHLHCNDIFSQVRNADGSPALPIQGWWDRQHAGAVQESERIGSRRCGLPTAELHSRQPFTAAGRSQPRSSGSISRAWAAILASTHRLWNVLPLQARARRRGHVPVQPACHRLLCPAGELPQRLTAHCSGGFFWAGPYAVTQTPLCILLKCLIMALIVQQACQT